MDTQETSARRKWSKIVVEIFAAAVMLAMSAVLTVLVLWTRGIIRIGKALLQVLDGVRIILVSPLTTIIQTLLIMWVMTPRIIAGESRESITEELRARCREWGEAPGRRGSFRPGDRARGAW
jgi:hypothetical protein